MAPAEVPDPKAPTGAAGDGDQPAPDAPVGAATAVDPDDSDEPELLEASPLVLLRLRLGVDAAADRWLVRYLDVREHFDAGDNRRTQRGLKTLLAEDLPRPLRDEALRLQARLRPDPAALIVAAISTLMLIAIWIAAVSAG